MFDPNTKIYELAVPKCEAGWDYHLLPIDMQVESEEVSGVVRVKVGEEDETATRSLNLILGENSGLQDYMFEGLRVVIEVSLPTSDEPSTYTVTIRPTLEDKKLIEKKCLLCPAPKNHPKPYTCKVENATLLGNSCTCDHGFSGELTLDKKTRTFSGRCIPKLTCAIPHATLHGKNCTCNAGYMGVLTHNPVTNTFTGSCPKIPPPKPTPPPRPPVGKWPCEGVTPYICDDCPTCDEAGRLIADLEKSCNIPEWMGLGGETYQEGTGYMPHLHEFGPEYKFADGRPDRIVYHTRWSRISKLNPVLHRHMCISPICRWRVEMAFNALANCQTLERPHGNDVVHWRNYTDFSMHTLKHIVLVMEAAKADCRKVSTPHNVFTGAEIQQTFRVVGVDITTDGTLREAELAFRQAFSNLLDFPLRRLNVRIEGEPHPECPLAFDSPVCQRVDCGYGQCIPKGDGSSHYECLCNQCYRPGRTESGQKTCVREPSCKIVDACIPNPCNCDGKCRNCPECPGERKYTCQCQMNFSGPQCTTLTCPHGFDRQAGLNGDQRCGICVPRENKNMCDPNPCQNGGACHVTTQKKHGFFCKCPEAYGGDICENVKCPAGMVLEGKACVHSYEAKKPAVKDPCSPDPCENDGYCKARGPKDFECQCLTGYKGNTCQVKINPCITAPSGEPYTTENGPCKTSFTCHPDDKMPSGYRCTCPDCESHLYDARGSYKTSKTGGNNYRRRLAHNMSEDTVVRMLEDAPEWVQYDWENTESVPEILPLPKQFPEHFDPLMHRSEHCTVYQNSQHMGAEIILSVKCPVDSGKGECDHLIAKLDHFRNGGERAILPLERRVQWNCIATKVTGVTEPHEEFQIANCPSHREFNFRWHYAYQECDFQSKGMSENAIWQLYMTQDGVETADPSYQDLFCKNPICRALILDLASLYKECPNSAPGYVGYCSRKTKALRNSVKACSNPDGVVVLRQQLQVQGVVDTLSLVELQAVEKWLAEEVTAKTGAPAERVNAHVQPVLHVNDWQSRVYPTFNSIYPTEILPQRGYGPDSLHTVAGQEPSASTCQGLCIKTLEPGKSNHPTDPMAAIFVTYNDPVRIGSCVDSGSCKITLIPAKTARGHYTLNNDEFSPRSELVVSGETLALFPRLSLKPLTNYTCHMDAGVVQSSKTGAMSSVTTFWFMTGKPRDSLVKLSISIGCDNQIQYDGYAGYMPDFHGSPEETLIDPIRRVIRKIREEKGVTERRRLDTEEELTDADKVVANDIARELYEQAQSFTPRELAGSEPPDATGGNPTPEVREVNPCKTGKYWWLFSWLILIPIIICIIAVWCASKGFEPWLQDILREGIGTNCAYTRMTDGGYRSKCVENRESLSFKLGGPVVYGPLLCILGLLLSAAFGAFWAWVIWGYNDNDNSVYYIGALFGAAMCAMIWAVWCAIISTWTNPGQLPFFRDNKVVTKMKWSENVPRSKRGPPCFLDIDYSAQSYTSTMVESDTKPEKVTVTVFRDVVQDGARAPSRMTIPLTSSQNAARCAFYLATLVFFAVLFLFTALAMHLCPEAHIINFIFFCILSGIFYGLLGALCWWLLARKHCWHAAVSVLYKPVREIRRTTKPNVVYEEAKEFLGKDIIFEEGSRVVKKLVVSPESPARAEHVKPGMELVQIKAIVPLGLGSPIVEFVGSSGEQGDAARLLRNFEDRFRYSSGKSDAFSDGGGNQSSKHVDIVLTFKHPKVQYSTPVY